MAVLADLLESEHSIVRNYGKLKTAPADVGELYATLVQEGEEVPRQNGYTGLQRYPFASNHDGKNPEGLDFQAVDFPYLAGEGKVKMLGNNQAHFFVRKTEKGIVEDTTHLKNLMGNVWENGTDFTLQIDSDVMVPFDDFPRDGENPYVGHPFVEKYWDLRGENLPDGSPDEKTRRTLLGDEAVAIQKLLSKKRIPEIAKEAIAQRLEKQGFATEDAQNVAEVESRGFLQENFKIEGVVTKERLSHATWKVDAPLGALMFKQTYDSHTHNINRKCEFGIEPELKQLKEAGHAGASDILATIEKTNSMPTVKLTLGMPPQGMSGPAASSPRR